jgi:hypothetical protein
MPPFATIAGSLLPNGRETRLSIKAFVNWGLSFGKCHDFDRAMGREQRTRSSLGFVVERVAGAGEWLGSAAAPIATGWSDR